MSRKNKHKQNPTQVGQADGAELVRRSLEILEPEDTGGLDLTKFASGGPVELPAVPYLVGENCNPSILPGLSMLQALSLSPIHYMAARLIESNLNVALVTNGRRFWTANAQTLEPLGMAFAGSPEVDQPTWRPIVGDENGLKIS